MERKLTNEEVRTFLESNRRQNQKRRLTQHSGSKGLKYTETTFETTGYEKCHTEGRKTVG